MTDPHPLDLLADGLVNAQVTSIIVDSDLFEPLRDLAAAALPAPWNALLTCHICTGTWVGIAQALLRTRRPADVARMAFAAAAAGRIVRTFTDRSL